MQEVHCSFYKKINELDDGTYSIARYHAISEVPKLALWKQDIFTVLGCLLYTSDAADEL